MISIVTTTLSKYQTTEMIGGSRMPRMPMYASHYVPIDHICFRLRTYRLCLLQTTYLQIMYASDYVSIDHVCFTLRIYRSCMLQTTYLQIMYALDYVPINHVCFRLRTYKLCMLQTTYLYIKKTPSTEAIFSVVSLTANIKNDGINFKQTYL